MVKNVLFAVIAMVVFVSSVRAEDGLLDGLDTAAITDAQVQIEQSGLDGLDVGALQNQAGEEKSDEAIEACFRRFGWGGYGCGYPSYSFYNSGCYRPVYSYSCYEPFYCYRPVVRVYTPSYYYWGCY